MSHHESQKLQLGFQLADPHAERFTQQELREAMLKTIATLNDWARELNITEV